MNNLKTDTNIKISISFIIFGLLAFVFSQIILVLNSNELLTGMFRIPQIWMSAHFLLLGFAVMVAMGAMYQLVPVVFLTPIWNQAFGFIQLGVTAVGITSFALLLGYRTNIAVHGTVLLIIGVLMFIFQMAMTLRKQEKINNMTKFIVAALVFLILTITAGFLLAFNLAFGEKIDHIPILLSHMTFGVAGWFTLLIISMSYKLVPMFSLSHGFSMKWMKLSFVHYIAGMISSILSYWFHSETLFTIGFFLLFLGFLYFALDMKEILTKRVKKKLDAPFSFAVLAILNGLIVHMLAFLLSLFGFGSVETWSWVIYLYITTWILFSILGYLYKIIPFLWWTHKYSEKVGKEEVPMLKVMLNEKLGKVLYWLFSINVVGIITSVALQNGIMLFIFFGLQALTATIYALSIITIFLK